MFKKAIESAVSRAKTEYVTDFGIRYNPCVRRNIAHMLSRSAQPELMTRLTRAARRTGYGKHHSASLADWPLLEKETLRLRPHDLINPRSLIRIPASTGGTSGIPLPLWRSLECIAAEQFFIDKLMEPYGFSMRSKVAVLRADSVKPPGDAAPPYGRISHGGNRLTLSSPHLNPETIGWFHDALERFGASVLWVYPSAAGNLLALCARAGLTLSIPVILSSSEMLSASLHRELESYFHSKVINYYGQAERVCFAVSTRPDEFFFNPAYGRVELEIVAPQSDTENAARIIGTNYWNLAMPLIRYDTGDLIYVPREYGAQELEEIAQGKRPFASMAGRDSEYILTKDGMRIIGLNQVPRNVAHIRQLQMVQTALDEVAINVLTLPGYSAQDADRIEHQARAKLPSSIRISVQPAERLQSTARGKVPLVIRMI